MSPKSFLMMVAQGNKQKQPGEERNDDNSDSRPGEELKVKMFLAKEPCRAPAEEAPTYLGFLGRVGIGHEIFHKSKLSASGRSITNGALGWHVQSRLSTEPEQEIIRRPARPRG